MRVVAIIQARMGSSRLPGKVLHEIGGLPLLALMLGRLERSRTLDSVWVATSVNDPDDAVAAGCESLHVPVCRGPEADVLERYRLAAAESRADLIVRLTADCPLICAEVTDRVVTELAVAGRPVDYASNTLRRTFPRGLDSEALPASVLREAAREASLPGDREHVTRFVWRQPDRYRLVSIEDAQDHSRLRWTVDEPADLELMHAVADELGDRLLTATYEDLLALFADRPSLARINAHVAQKPC